MRSNHRTAKGTRVLPLLPLRDIVVFPHMVVPLFVGRERSIEALEKAMGGGRRLLLAAQKQARVNEPYSPMARNRAYPPARSAQAGQVPQPYPHSCLSFRLPL